MEDNLPCTMAAKGRQSLTINWVGVTQNPDKKIFENTSKWKYIPRSLIDNFYFSLEKYLWS